MRLRVLMGFVLAALMALSAMGAQSCGTTTKSTPNAGGSSGGGGGSGGSSGPKLAKLGDTITLSGTSNKERMAVTPTKVLDPLPVGSFDKPLNPKSRFVGVLVTLKSVGSKTYNDSPGNGATLVTADSQQGDSTIVSEGPCSGQFSANANISPGSELRGCIPFEVPGKKPVAKFQFTLESGFGPQSGEWAVK
jgi:hypothetical protein